MSSQIDDYELIKLIQEYPILFDKTNSRGPKNATRKDDAWREISLKLAASERACITRWKSIRDRFGKEFRRVQEHPDEPTYWDMFPHLLFLKNHYKYGTAKCNLLESIKFAPKQRKRKTPRWNASQSKPTASTSATEEDAGLEDVPLNQNLIALVKEHPVLYDRQKIRDSKNITAKNKAWREISNTLNITEEVLYKRWKKLRDRFAREYRNYQINNSVPVTWVYYQDLNFLESHYRKGVPLNLDNLKRRGRPPLYANRRSKRMRSESANENNWSTEFTCSTEEDEPDIIEDDDNEDEIITTYNEAEDEEIEQQDDHEGVHIVQEQDDDVRYIELKGDDLDEFVLSPEAQQNQLPIEKVPTDVQPSTPPPTTAASAQNTQDLQTFLITKEENDFGGSEEPTEKLANVITNMECVLRQSQDCLKALQEHNQRYEMELRATTEAAAISADATLAALTNSPHEALLRKTQMLLSDLKTHQKDKAIRKILQFLCECQIKDLNEQCVEDIADINFF